jgi:hypothetical protein
MQKHFQNYEQQYQHQQQQQQQQLQQNPKQKEKQSTSQSLFLASNLLDDDNLESDTIKSDIDHQKQNVIQCDEQINSKLESLNLKMLNSKNTNFYKNTSDNVQESSKSNEKRTGNASFQYGEDQLVIENRDEDTFGNANNIRKDSKAETKNLIHQDQDLQQEQLLPFVSFSFLTLSSTNKNNNSNLINNELNSNKKNSLQQLDNESYLKKKLFDTQTNSTDLMPVNSDNSNDRSEQTLVELNSISLLNNELNINSKELKRTIKNSETATSIVLESDPHEKCNEKKYLKNKNMISSKDDKDVNTIKAKQKKMSAFALFGRTIAAR